MSESEVGQQLKVYLGEEHVGALEHRGPKRYRFRYADSILSQNDTGDVVLSASLPVQSDAFEPAKTRPFFDGLLPEGAIRDALAQTLGVSREDGFALLRELGADCAGAVTVLRDGESPTSGEGRVDSLSDEELARLVEELPQHPLGVDREVAGVRLSLGGIQEKLVLTRSPEGTYGRPLGGAPSTCILKPEHGDYPEIVANETFGQRLAQSVGLDAARVEPLDISGRPCLYIKRFDRTIADDGRITRVHQEDMCQALGIDPTDKYEASGGPSIARMVQLLRDLSSPRAAKDILELVKAVLVNFLLGNSDAHGKNYGLLYGADGIRLAPLYDLVSTQVYPKTERALAMSIGGVAEPDAIDLAAWERLAEDCGMGSLSGQIGEWMRQVLECTDALVATAGAERWHRPVVDRIAALVKTRATQLKV